MDPDRYCLDEAAPPGSSLYYATLFTGARERDALVAVHAFRRTLLGIVETIADPIVRAHKLNWWSDEIMEARDGRARHPVAIAISRHGGTLIWRRPEALEMLAGVARVSAANGLVSESARDLFCEEVGGITALLCAAAVERASCDAATARLRMLGTALEGAILAGAPRIGTGLTSLGTAASHAPDRRIADPGARAVPDSLERSDRNDRSCDTPGRIADGRVWARETLAGAARGVSPHEDPAALVYRTLAQIQLAALANAIRKSPPHRPRPASITPLRKLWIAWRTMHRTG